MYTISDLELASRLSFFLWSSLPDDELLRLAERGTLNDPGILQIQVRRMLTDDRSSSLINNFVGQWLLLRNLRGFKPNPEVFPDWDEELRAAFQRETELFFEDQIRKDRSVMELLTANYTFANERLARHYEIPNVFGTNFRRVTIPAGSPRGGLLGQGSLLAVTSYPNRTSPVLRGKWVLENLLGSPPPQPPPNVPNLKERSEGGRPTSVRERLEEHRKSPACSVCHAPMDPLGFALENFDAIGQWRTMDDGAKIDASGTLPGDAPFEGPAGLRSVLGQRSEQFVDTFVEKMLTYATGRALESFDFPTVRKIRRDAVSKDYRWSAIVLGVVTSPPFRMRQVRSEDPGAVGIKSAAR